MQKTLKRMFDGINSITDIKAPTDKIGDREVVIGQIDDVEIQKFYCFFIQNIDNLAELVKKHLHEVVEMLPGHCETDPLKCPTCKIIAELESERQFGDAVKALFASAVLESLPLEGKIQASKGGGIGIRSDWKIVVAPNLLEPRLFFY